jgi:hypothetical protein
MLLSPEQAARTLEPLSGKWGETLQDGGSILLMDVRRHPPGWRQPLTRIETGSESTGTLLLILADPGDDLTSGNRICHSDRWRFSGSITPDRIAVLVKSVFQAFVAWTELPANPSATLKMSSFRTSPPARAEKD